MMSQVFRPVARSAELLVTDLGDEIVIFDDRTEVVHVLGEPAATVWRLCDGDTTVAQITAAVVELLDVDETAADDATVAALSQLAELDLLEVPTQATASISRRRILKLAGVAAGAAFAMPLIETIGGVVAGPAGASSHNCYYFKADPPCTGDWTQQVNNEVCGPAPTGVSAPAACVPENPSCTSESGVTTLTFLLPAILNDQNVDFVVKKGSNPTGCITLTPEYGPSTHIDPDDSRWVWTIKRSFQTVTLSWAGNDSSDAPSHIDVYYCCEETTTTPAPTTTPGTSTTPAPTTTPGTSTTPAPTTTPGTSTTPAPTTTPGATVLGTTTTAPSRVLGVTVTPNFTG